MLKRATALLTGFLLAFGAAWTYAEGLSEVIPDDQKVQPVLTGAEEIQLPDHAARPVLPTDELDEIVGDTVIVGYSYWDAQHNGTVGRMIAYDPADTTLGPVVHMVYARLEGETTGSTRHVRYNRVLIGDDGFTVEEAFDGGYNVDSRQRAGYTTLPMDWENHLPFPAFHSRATSNDPWGQTIGNEFIFLPGVFNLYDFPEYTGNEVLWPRGIFGGGYAHVVGTASRTDNVAETVITYSRVSYDPDTGWNMATPDGLQQLVTDHGMNISADVGVSDDGMRIVIAQTVSRDWLYYGGGGYDGSGAGQWNNDIWVWESTDGGVTWNWDTPMDLTQCIFPDESYLPDTLAAERDTLRPYTDTNVYIDHDGILHIAFTAMEYFVIEGVGTYTSILYHWDEESDVFTRIADGRHWNYARPESWGRVVERPSMVQDPETGILYCVYEKYGEPDEFIEDDDGFLHGMDASDDGYANSDVYVAASPPNNIFGNWYGRMWSKGVNITNTKSTDGNLLPGESRSEQDPSVSLVNDSDYLYIQYLIDLDPGIAITDPPEGEMTYNPVVMHRVAKTDLMDAMESQAEWVTNYPFHVDSTRFWWDTEYEYAWDDVGGFYRDQGAVGSETGELLPGEYTLEQNYPNPFNPSTRIAFRIERAGAVKLTVHDLLGREVATLLNRPLEAGRHEVSFEAGDLPSGVFFYTLSSGERSVTRKMVLMK